MEKQVFSWRNQRQRILLMHFVPKQVFSWHDKNSYIWGIITWKSSFSYDAPKNAHLLDYNVEKQLFSWHAKFFIFIAFIHGNAGFLMMWPKAKCTFDAFLHFEAAFLVTRKNSYIWCIITWKSRYSHHAPKRCKFAALLGGKAGFPMTRQKL